MTFIEYLLCSKQYSRCFKWIDLMPITPNEVDTRTICILQLRALRWFAQGHTVAKWQIWNMNTGTVAFESPSLPPCHTAALRLSVCKHFVNVKARNPLLITFLHMPRLLPLGLKHLKHLSKEPLSHDILHLRFHLLLLQVLILHILWDRAQMPLPPGNPSYSS